jgi:ubiquitin fusion degradation protein 1
MTNGASKRKIVSNETLESGAKVPAALNLPFGQLFFGFNVVAYISPAPSSPGNAPQVVTCYAKPPPLLTTSQHASPFSGTGNTLSGRSNFLASTKKGKEKENEEEETTSSSVPNHTWGSGQSLGKRTIAQRGAVGVGDAAVPHFPQRGKQRSPSPEEEEDWGVDEDEDVIMIDSD